MIDKEYANKTYLLFILFILICHPCESFQTSIESQKLLESYLLPEDHPLQGYLGRLFRNSKMFQSLKNFKKAGFKVNHGHKELMVGGHFSIPHYLFKKFPDSQSQTKQLENYMRRIKGANILRECIKKHHFKHLVVPQKWLYELPRRFLKESGAPSYLLIVENMNIYSRKSNLKLYYHMDIEVLTELCIILHEIGGLDAAPRNIPFTHSKKIAFIDTEHVGQRKYTFFKYLVPALNKELQAYAIDLWNKLEEEKALKQE